MKLLIQKETLQSDSERWTDNFCSRNLRPWNFLQINCTQLYATEHNGTTV